MIGGLASFGPLSLDLYLPALPRVATTLGASAAVTQLSVSCCLIGLAAGQFLFGPLGDRFGRRTPLLVGVTVWTASALLCAIAPDAPVLIGLRVIQGFGGAAGLVLSRAVVRDLYDSDALARAFAIVALISNVTPAIAPVAGGGLLQVMSWRDLFVVLFGIGALLLAGVIWFLPESLPPERRHAGGVRATVTLTRALVADHLFRSAATAFALGSAMMFTYLSLSSFVLQHRFGLSAAGFSFVFAGNSVGIILAGSATLRLLRHVSPARLMGAGLLAAVVSTLALCAAVLGGAPTWAVLVCLLCCVSTIGTTFPTATTLALMHQGDAAGAGSAVLGGTQYGVGGLAGPVVSLAGETATAMSVAMAAFAAAGLAVYGATGIGREPLPAVDGRNPPAP